ncbi:CoA transferase [Halalkalicoccus salilacus]|uniref:CoA transferase n=1 Tax=Halalkalicoccus sp. GCM10025704 TaxID=3252662 RepID=UPI00360E2BE0
MPAIKPDWAIVHAQRASPEGDVHLWGNTGITDPAVGAAENILVTAEEIVDPDIIKSDPAESRSPRSK